MALLGKWLWRFHLNNPLFGPPSSGVFSGLALKGRTPRIFFIPLTGDRGKVFLKSLTFSYPHITFSLGCGSNIRFWLDPLASSQPFSSLFPRIFGLSFKKSAPVLDFFLGSSWNLHLRRHTRDVELEELSSFLSVISSLSPSPPPSRL